jgi:TolB protein
MASRRRWTTLPGFDDRLTRELERIARPADPAGVLDRVQVRRARRARSRRITSALLAIAVIGATTVGFVALREAFREGGRGRTAIGPLHSNGQIVFSHVGGGGRLQLFVAQSDGSQTRTLTPSGPFDDLNPAVSPDGTTVVFQRRLDGAGFVIASIPITGGAVTELTERAVVLEPAWSPDGTMIAFTGSLDDDAFGLWVMDADGSDPRRIAGSGSFDTLSPSWSPDGSRIAFVGFDDDAGLLDDVYTITPEGADMTRLTETPALRELSPAWSPDGRTIAFARSGDSMEDSEIWAIHPNGSSPVLVERAPMSFMDQLAWAPDATALLASFHGWVHLVDFDEGGFVRLVEGTTAAWQPLPPGSAISPTPEPSASPDPEPEGRDIGLAFRLCDLHGLGGIDFLDDGVDGRAWTGTKVLDDGTCPPPNNDRYGVAVDFTGDGVADSWSGETIEACGGCEPFKGMDLNGDGREELIVILQYFSIMQYGVYTIVEVNGEPEVVPFRTGQPGHPEHSLDAGKPFTFWVGGDEGSADWFSCDTLPMFWLTGVFSPEGGPVKTVHVTQVSLGTDGIAEILFADTYTVPPDVQLELPHTSPDHSDPDCGMGVRPG